MASTPMGGSVYPGAGELPAPGLDDVMTSTILGRGELDTGTATLELAPE
jgi:hypothetical protein